MIIKILQPIGHEDQKWIQKLRDEFSHIFIEATDTRKFDEETLIRFVHDAHVLLLSNRPISTKVLEACNHLRFISVAFTGLDHIDMKMCTTKNIPVKNAAGYATHAVAELTLCLSLNLYRNIREEAANLTAPSSHHSMGHELYGKKVGIVGGGAIGLETARLFSAFGCAVSIFHHRPLSPISYAKQVPLDMLLTTSDIISLHLPLLPETTNFLNKERLALMKPSAILINAARGPIVDQQALIHALNHNTIAGAALDVFDQEPPLPNDHPVLKTKNLILTPHIGYRTEEAFDRRSAIAFNNLRTFLLNHL